MASKGNTRSAAVEFLKTGVAPEIVEEEQGTDLDETLTELATEQEAAEVTKEVIEDPAAAEAEVPAVEAPAKEAEGKEVVPGEKPAEEADGNVAEVVVDPNALSEEVAALPRVQELLKQEESLNVLKDALVEGYAIDTTDFPKAIEQLRLVKADADMFYGIIDGAIPASTFLTNLEKGFDQKKVVEPIYLSMADHLGRNGFLEAYLDSKGFTLTPKVAPAEGQAAKTLNQTLAAGSNLNPEVKALQDRIATLEGRGAAVNPDNAKHEAAFEGEVKRLMAETKVPADFFNDYKAALVEMIQRYPGGSNAILGRIRAGNFVDVKRFFTTHNNAQLERSQKYLKPQVEAKKVVTPTAKKPVAAPVKPALVKKTAPATKSDRIAAAMANLKE